MLVSLALVSCNTTKPYYSKKVRDWREKEEPKSGLIQSVYLIGDVGSPKDDESSLALLKQMLDAEDPEKTAVVFLGDNLYPQGLHSKGHPERAIDEKHLDLQINTVKEFEGRKLFIPGNHDWKEGKKEGYKFVRRQEKYIEDVLGGKKTFLPNKGCPGPEVLKLGDDVRMIVIDTQWWLHKYKRGEGERFGCDVKDEIEFTALVKDELRRNRNQHMLVVGHHPFLTNGNHGGEYTIRDHIFPLTNVKKDLYVPLPVIGSIYPLYRQVLGSHQDIAHPRYQSLISNIKPLFEDYPGTIYASGHEHNLQYTEENGVHYVVSGSGCKESYLDHGKPLTFGQNTKGFSKIKYYDDGEVWIEFYSGNKNEMGDHLLFKKMLYQKKIEEVLPQPEEKKSYKGIKGKVIPFQRYEANGLKQVFFGKQHRESWTNEIEVPYLDINYVKGGLFPLKKGGGMQTKSLRFEGGDGHQYVIRTIQKDATSLVSRSMRNTVAQDVLLDGLSASHPYAAVVVPPIADAVKVFHTNPQLVIVPDDPGLMEYRNEFANRLCLFEERPAYDQSHKASFGFSKNVIGSGDMIEKLQDSYKHQVSDIAMLRARLLDILLADWDRHDDQWRWASYKHSKGTTYKPIPRDRDQVFFYQDGFIPNITNRKWAVRKFQSFKPEIRDMIGQCFNARYVDRAYLTELEEKDWIAVADSMMNELTDEVLLEGMKRLPPEGFAINGMELLEVLKQRRDNLKMFALEHYRIVSKHVNVVGTKKDEFFEVIRQEDGSTLVNVFPRKKGKPEREKLIYSRVFDPEVTEEINIYGLGGNDEYKVRGDVKKGTVVRIIGGLDRDKIDAESSVKGLSRMTHVYDNKEKKKKRKLTIGDEATLKYFKKSQPIGYEREEYKFNNTMPLLWLGFNPDDGVYLGAGFIHTEQGWKREPYKHRHALKGNYAVRTGAFNFDYDWDYPELIGNWDLSGTMEIKAPKYQFFYYGLGNETERMDNAENDYSLRLNELYFEPQLRRRVRGLHYLAIGPTFQYVNSTGERSSIYDLVDTLPAPADLEERFFGGGAVEYVLDNKDNSMDPQRGIYFRAKAGYWNDFKDGDVSFSKLESEIRLYTPMHFMPGRTVLALRAGGATNIGDSEFYQANFIGGISNFRGLRRNRFGGESSFYSSAEMRMQVAEWFNYIIPINFGLLAFSDQGRVWVDGESSDKIHHSLGGGIFISPLNALVINASFAVSDDDELFFLQFGFAF